MNMPRWNGPRGIFFFTYWQVLSGYRNIVGHVLRDDREGEYGAYRVGPAQDKRPKSRAIAAANHTHRTRGCGRRLTL